VFFLSDACGNGKHSECGGFAVLSGDSLPCGCKCGHAVHVNVKREKRQIAAHDALSWSSMVLVLLAYGLLSFGVFERTDALYHSMNLFGALGLGLDCFRKKAFPPMVLNIFFAAIAVVTLARFMF